MNSAAKPVTAADLETLVASLSEVIKADFSRLAPHVTVPTLSVELGRRYARIVKFDGSSRSAFMFVDMTNGDILKPHGWKGPAKHARGNIFAEKPLARVRAYSVG